MLKKKHRPTPLYTKETSERREREKGACLINLCVITYPTGGVCHSLMLNDIWRKLSSSVISENKQPVSVA